MTQLDLPSALYPSQLDHIRIDSDDPRALAKFYQDTLGMAAVPLKDDTFLMVGAERRLVIGSGSPGEQPYSGFRLGSSAQLSGLRDHLTSLGIETVPISSPFFVGECLGVRDPDGRHLVFGLPNPELESLDIGTSTPVRTLPARLQHVVVATSRLSEHVRFYEKLGFLPSDYVYAEEEGEKAMVAGFWRSNREHHSLAAFRAPAAKPDHHSYEVGSWNAIRDWADHFATLEVKLWWGPGRHGPGNNLFVMVEDPHGYKIELSCELEIVPPEMAPRNWPHTWKASNLWGPSWFRS